MAWPVVSYTLQRYCCIVPKLHKIPPNYRYEHSVQVGKYQCEQAKYALLGIHCGHKIAQSVEVLSNKPEDRRFDSLWYHLLFH